MSWKGDPNAFHQVVDGEINGLTEKATPVDADLIVIEDSADSNSKKKAQLGNLPGSGGATDHGALTGLGDDDHPQYLTEPEHDALDHSGLTDAATVIHGAEPQSDGSLRFRYGVDSSGRPTYTAAGTSDTPAFVFLEDDRFHVREVSL